MVKKVYLFIASIAILASSFPTEASADNWTSSGNYSIGWYNKTQSEFVINNNKELAGIAYLVNNGYTNFKNVVIKLGQDISLSGKDWITIGLDDSHSFQGTFDGQGHTISGITIVRESGDKNYFAFWGNLLNATIKNVYFIGTTDVTEPTYNYLKQYSAGVAAYAENCTFEHCICKTDVTYFRKKTNSFGPSSSSNKYLVKVGGIIGYAYKSSLSYCKHEGDVKVSFGSNPTNGEYYSSEQTNCVGGIVGEAYSTHIKYCENQSGIISNDASGTKNSDARFYMHLGGIAGTASRGSIISCTSNSAFNALFRGSMTMYMAIGGIVGFAYTTRYEREPTSSCLNIYNCYSPTTLITAGAGSSTTNVYYGGIIGQNPDNGNVSMASANFGASDITINQTTLVKLKGYGGSTSYSSAQMQTDEFLEELNIYPVLEFGKPVWTRDNGYPYIKEIEESTGVLQPVFDNEIRNNSIYSISGKRIQSPQKGLNIVKTSDGKTRKMIVK